MEAILTNTQEIFELFDFDLKIHSIAAQKKIKNSINKSSLRRLGIPT